MVALVILRTGIEIIRLSAEDLMDTLPGRALNQRIIELLTEANHSSIMFEQLLEQLEAEQAIIREAREERAQLMNAKLDAQFEAQRGAMDMPEIDEAREQDNAPSVSVEDTEQTREKDLAWLRQQSGAYDVTVTERPNTESGP